MLRRRRRKIERLDFVLAGAQKSGTTALHYFLSRHPDICMGDQQEIHFFDFARSALGVRGVFAPLFERTPGVPKKRREGAVALQKLRGIE